jgi:hypothetical protein
MNEEVSQNKLCLIKDASFKKSAPFKKNANLDSIVRRCNFVSSSINLSECVSNLEWNTLINIIQLTKNGSLFVEKLANQRQADPIDFENSPDIEEAPQSPSCAWINQITDGIHCDRCDMCNIIDSPINFGFSPWNTNKRIMYLDGHLDDEILVSEAVLAEYPEIYYQDERLVRVIGNRSKAVTGSQHIPLQVKSVTAANLKEMLSTKFVFLKVEEDRVRAVYPPPPLIGALLERAKYPSLKHLRGVTEVPVLRPDGTVLQDVGYDPVTELLYQPLQPFPTVPEHPTQDEIQAAIHLLLDVVCDFPFISDVGRAVYLSTLLTVVGRYAFLGCVPMILIDANTPGVGKTKLADTIGIITTGQPLPRSTQANYAEEERRQITSILRKGERLLLIDNIGACFGSPVLDALLTSEIWQDRLLGRSQEVTLPNLLQVIATGNNLQLKADTVRRCLRLQLNTSEEHPESRSEFKYANLEAWVMDHQAELLTAALTLLRGYMAAGRPKQELITLGSFAGWSGLIQSTVKWAYGVDPGEARVLGDDEMDLDKEILERLIRGWRNLVPDGKPVSCRTVFDRTIKDSELGRDIHEALELRHSSGKRSAVALGHLLTRYRKRVYMGAYFDHGSKERTSEGRSWKLFTQ